MQPCSFRLSVGVATIMGAMVRCRSRRVVSVVLVTGPRLVEDTVLSECSALVC